MAPPAGPIRPWRYLAAFLGIVVVLYALVFFTGDRIARPKLGIDLEGGTQVTLTARTPNGAPPTREQLIQARQIIETRVNEFGVSGAQVVQSNANIVITVPGDQGSKANDLAETALLRIRPVIAGPVSAETPAAPPGGATPATPPRSSRHGGASQHGESGTQKHSSKATESTKPTPAPGPGSSAPHGQFQLPAEPPNPNPPAPPGGSADQAPPTAANPELETQIAMARAERQNPALATSQAMQEMALQDLNCSGKDVLKGYDDPAKPLVTCDQQSREKYVLGPTLLEGTEIANASSGYDQQKAENAVYLNFNAAGTKTWGDYTATHSGTAAAFVLDGQVVSAPSISEPIYGTTQITGSFSQSSAQQLAQVLKYGALPLSFSNSNAETVSATLGLASLQAGLIAGAIGLALVFVYCLFYYRALGVLTILSLALSGIVVYAVLVLLGRGIGFTLDLAGVAGFIVSIGITADSFVIFFERLKDEVREGRSFRAAVPRGWIRARRTILTADAVSFLASAVLYILAIGDVRGFAFTLGMSTVLDLVDVFLVTHPLVALASDSRLFSSPAWSGLGAVARIGAMRRRAAAAAAAATKGA
ncbi:MAG TPA: protein translocase subunit SecD [Pseudonocardia sp.]